MRDFAGKTTLKAADFVLKPKNRPAAPDAIADGHITELAPGGVTISEQDVAAGRLATSIQMVV